VEVSLGTALKFQIAESFVTGERLKCHAVKFAIGIRTSHTGRFYMGTALKFQTEYFVTEEGLVML